MIERLWWIAYGATLVLVGLCVLVTVGFWCPKWHLSLTLAWARYDMRRREGSGTV